MLSAGDQRLRGILALAIAETGHAPSTAALAERAGLPVAEVEAGLRRLHDGHALLLHPGDGCRPWVVHPFALAPGGCWVQTPHLGYWANCLYCAFGIAAVLKTDVVISTRIGGEGEAVRYAVEGGRAPVTTDVFHLSVPVARWWDNVVFACSSFQPFHAEPDVDAWCARHALPRGAVLTMPALWAFASDWYGKHLDQPWRKRSLEEVRALFARHGLTGDFWTI
jgi:alkylmercury lyase-like protein